MWRELTTLRLEYMSELKRAPAFEGSCRWHTCTPRRDHRTVIVCPGVINFLDIDQTTGQSSLRFDSVAEAVDHITSLINEGDVNYHTAYPHSHMIFGLLTGIDLATYPMTNEKDTFKQYVVDASIIRINEEIVAVNERNHLPTP